MTTGSTVADGYRGMRWFKSDLHVHTPEDAVHWLDHVLRLESPRRPKVKGVRNEDRIQEIARTYLRRCHELGLEVIGVTDHNFSDWADPRDRFLTHLVQQNRAVAKELDREPIWIFPGFEVDIGYHLLCLFPPTQRSVNQVEAVDVALSALGLPRGSRLQDGGKPAHLRREDGDVPLRTLLKIVQEEHGGIVIAAHAFSNDGICKGSSHRDDYQLEELLCVEVRKWPLGEREQAVLLPTGGEWARTRPPAYIMSSDAKSLRVDDEGKPHPNALGYRHTWIKMSVPSIEALRQAFLDPDSRINLPEDPASDFRPSDRQKHARILSLRAKGTEFLADMELSLSPNLTCIIGGRGTGKSTLLEYARLCLRQDADVSDQAQEQVTRIRDTLTDDSLLGLEWQDQDGVHERVEVMGRGSKAQIAGRIVDRPGAVFDRMDVRIYGQRELSDLTRLDKHRQPVFLLPLVDGLCGNDLAELKGQEAELRHDIEAMLARRRALDEKRAKLDDLRQEEVELTRQWSTRAEVREEAERHRRAQEAHRYVAKVEADAADLARRLREQAKEWVEAHAPLGSVVEHWPETEWFKRLDEGWEGAKDSLAADLRAAADRFEVAVHGHASGHASWPAIESTIAAATKAFKKACEDRGLGPDDVGRLQVIERDRRAKQIEIERLENELVHEEKLSATIGDENEALRGIWRKQYDVRRKLADRIRQSEAIPKVKRDDSSEETSFVTLSFSYMGERQDFLRTWDTLAPDRRTKLGRAWEGLGESLHATHMAALLERGDDDAAEAEASDQVDESATGAPPASPWDRLEEWMADASQIPADYRDLARELSEHLRTSLRERWEKARLVRVRDSVDLEMFRPDGTAVGSLQEGKLSDGQRNTAVLAILLADGSGPVLIDQPEDELDSAFIYQQLVPLLRQVKQHRQIIVVTHNPNLPVNGDAELVIALETRDGRGVLRAVGGLDIEEVNRAVLDIMEGSPDAFRKRREKYGY